MKARSKRSTIKYSKSFKAGLILVTLILLLALVGLFWTPYDVNEMSFMLKNKAPSLLHPFGTDNFGRDILSRVMQGASLSFLIAVAVVGTGTVVGTVIGALTGYFGGVVDAVLMRVNDALSAFPGVLMALVIIAVIGNGKYNLILALGIVFVPSYVRVVRGEVLKQKELDYVKNMKLMGASDLHIIFIDILPNIKTALTASVLIGFQNAVLSEAGMSYLGLGVTPPDPSLGRMLSEAQSCLIYAPWYAIAPGLTILFLTLGLGFVSHGLAER
ncbi:MAG: ABC transporter permease [Lachnospiraceae bacterium]|nr:ABC transporter permease [Lachnospiraceae bacterium]